MLIELLNRLYTFNEVELISKKKLGYWCTIKLVIRETKVNSIKTNSSLLSMYDVLSLLNCRL